MFAALTVLVAIFAGTLIEMLEISGFDGDVMDKVVAEVVIGALVLSLLIFIIPLYQQNSPLNTAEKADYSEKIKEVMLPNLRMAQNVQDVIAAIRYYELKGGAVIRVWDMINGSCVYEGEARSRYLSNRPAGCV